MSLRPENTPGRKPGLFYGWYMVGVAWTMIFLSSAVPISIFFKPILDDFGWSRMTLSLVQTVAMLVSVALTPLIGLLIDRIGPRAMLFIGTVVQSLSNLITGLAGNLAFIYTGRIMAEVRPMAASQVLINRWFIKKRGRAQGIVATGMPIGSFALVPLSQYLIFAWGWRPTLFFWAGAFFVIMMLLTWFVKDKPRDKGTVPDGILVQEEPLSDVPRSGAAADNVDRGNTLSESVRTGAFWLVTGAQFICGIGCGFMMTHIVIFATDIGYSEMIGAALVSIQGFFNLFGVLFTGYLSDRIARKNVLSLTHFIRGVSFTIIIIFLLLGGGSLWILFLAMALFGFGWFTTAPLTAGLTADLFGYKKMGTIAGAITMGHVVGTAIGVYGGGLVFELTGSYFRFFLVQGGLELLAAVMAFSVRRKASY